jgi:hypothetical protein
MFRKIEITPGDFVIGARLGSNSRAFTEPSQVLEIKEDKILVFLEEEAVWLPLQSVERVVIAYER